MEWIKVEDRLPEENCECIIALKNSKKLIHVFYLNVYSLFVTPNGIGILNVTYWMPLPNPPKN